MQKPVKMAIGRVFFHFFTIEPPKIRVEPPPPAWKLKNGRGAHPWSLHTNNIQLVMNPLRLRIEERPLCPSRKYSPPPKFVTVGWDWKGPFIFSKIANKVLYMSTLNALYEGVNGFMTDWLTYGFAFNQWWHQVWKRRGHQPKRGPVKVAT